MGEGEKKEEKKRFGAGGREGSGWEWLVVEKQEVRTADNESVYRVQVRARACACEQTDLEVPFAALVRTVVSASKICCYHCEGVRVRRGKGGVQVGY